MTKKTVLFWQAMTIIMIVSDHNLDDEIFETSEMRGCSCYNPKSHATKCSGLKHKVFRFIARHVVFSRFMLRTTKKNNLF